MPHSRFSFVNEAPSDPILGLTEEFKKDNNPSKVNLGVGVYYNDEGKIPVLNEINSIHVKIRKVAYSEGVTYIL